MDENVEAGQGALDGVSSEGEREANTAHIKGFASEVLREKAEEIAAEGLSMLDGHAYFFPAIHSVPHRETFAFKDAATKAAYKLHFYQTARLTKAQAVVFVVEAWASKPKGGPVVMPSDDPERISCVVAAAVGPAINPFGLMREVAEDHDGDGDSHIAIGEETRMDDVECRLVARWW